MEDIKKKLIEHDFAINTLDVSIKDLSETTKDSNIKLGTIAKSMGKQELILEKLTNLDEKTDDNINRVYLRINEMIEEMKTTRVRIESIDQKIAKTSTELVKLDARVKVSEKRLEDLESSQAWVVKTIVGGLITGLILTLFVLARK